MTVRKKTRRHRYPSTTKNLKNFLVEGYVVPIQLFVHEFTQACSKAQAMRDVYLRLYKRYPRIVIPPLKDYCDVRETRPPRVPQPT